jgi:hypothetical protein
MSTSLMPEKINTIDQLGQTTHWTGLCGRIYIVGYIDVHAHNNPLFAITLTE